MKEVEAYFIGRDFTEDETTKSTYMARVFQGDEEEVGLELLAEQIQDLPESLYPYLDGEYRFRDAMKFGDADYITINGERVENREPVASTLN